MNKEEREFVRWWW